MKFKLGEYTGEIIFLTYSNGRIAFSWSNKEDGPLATVTVNLPEQKLKEDEVIIDTNNMNNIGPVRLELVKQGFIKEFIGYSSSGYCLYPIYKVTQEVLDIINS